MKKAAYLVVLLFFLSGCAQTKEQLVTEEQPVMAKIDADHSELKRGIADLARKLDDIGYEIDSLSSEIDTLNLRVGDLPAAVATELKPVEEEAPTPPPVEEDIFEEPEKPEGEAVPEPVPPLKELYRKALDLYNTGSFDEAAATFDTLIATYPDTEYTDNAQYWKGECYYSKREYAKAVKEFEKVVENFPEGNKAPDAQLKIGYAYLEMGEIQKGKDTLQKTMDMFPFSDAAKMAAERLKSL